MKASQPRCSPAPKPVPALTGFLATPGGESVTDKVARSTESSRLFSWASSDSRFDSRWDSSPSIWTMSAIRVARASRTRTLATLAFSVARRLVTSTLCWVTSSLLWLRAATVPRPATWSVTEPSRACGTRRVRLDWAGWPGPAAWVFSSPT